MKKEASIVLIAFYNIKALGVRYLEAALRRSGYRVMTVFFKNFNSLHPKPTNDTELQLLTELVEREQPLFVGCSVMSSMYLETVDRVIQRLHEHAPALKIVCGGAYATMFPERFLSMGVDFVIRADGEIPICRLADTLLQGGDYSGIPSLCYTRGGAAVINDIGDILTDIDGCGLPSILCERACLIENGRLTDGDPQRDTLSYEVIASRGCPYTCSYCCCVNLRRLLPAGMQHVRTRSVQSVISELEEVKKSLKKLVFIHFYDEIFPNQPGWVEEFAEAYRQRIRLPFTIWSHPKAIDSAVLKKLVGAGLVEVIMGIQSGSEHIRREIFHRYETQEDILHAAQAIREAGVFWVSYDFMLQHPFESVEDLRQTYCLIKQLRRPFELQLHGLNFLPGTDIVEMAVAQGLVSQARMDKIMYAPMSEQFQAYWRQESDPVGQLWYKMIYCLQFPALCAKTEAYESDPAAHRVQIERVYERARLIAKLRYYRKKGGIVLRRLLR